MLTLPPSVTPTTKLNSAIPSSLEQDTVDEIKRTASTVNKFFILCFSYVFQGMFLKSINQIPQFQRHSFYVKPNAYKKEELDELDALKRGNE